MSELLIPKPQPDFPHQDINDINEAILRGAAFDPAFLSDSHRMSSQSALCQIGHTTIRSLGDSLFLDTNQLSALSAGAALYETVSVVANTQPRPIEHAFHIHTRTILDQVSGLASDGFGAATTMMDKVEDMKHNIPAAAAIIRDVAETYYSDPRVVTFGAALLYSVDRQLFPKAA